MNILLATYWILPHVGGVDTYLRTLKQGLEERGHQVDLLGHHPDMSRVHLLDDKKSVEKKTIHLPVYDILMDYFDREFPLLDHWARYRLIERHVFEMATVMLELNQYDLVHTQDIISTRALSRVIPKHIPHVATIHGMIHDEFVLTGEIDQADSMRWKYSYLEEKLGCSSADATILPTEWLRREFTNRFSVAPEKLTVVPYGLQAEAIAQQTDAIQHIPRSDGKQVIICPARLVPYKGQRYLIEALAKLARVRDDFVCQFAGEGPDRTELEALVGQHNLDHHIEFLGNRSDIFHLLKQASIFVLPSLVENHSLAIMEAQIIGLPIVTTRVGGNAELVSHHHTGLLVEPQNSEELFQALLMLMNNKTLREKLSHDARRWARKYWRHDFMVNRTLEVYEQVRLHKK
ncbi:glycosyltransferase family 4 protein [Brevibacillus sp. FSL K6-2834]|uniref:glycosyltransferase family 4 protein n=1 Tax=Brevibacillus sp. FSL K6-2834 TaxID=2954680 RepID=UPI003159714D